MPVENTPFCMSVNTWTAHEFVAVLFCCYFFQAATLVKPTFLNLIQRKCKKTLQNTCMVCKNPLHLYHTIEQNTTTTKSKLL